MNEQNKCVICGAIGNHKTRIMPFSLNNPNLMCIDCALNYKGPITKMIEKEQMKTKINNADSPAHPCKIPNYENPANNYTEHHGLTKREHIAALALQGLLSNHTRNESKNITYDAVSLADMLLDELEVKEWTAP